MVLSKKVAVPRLNDACPRQNHGNLTMIPIHNLMVTLTGCVIVYTRLKKKVNEVCGFSDSTTASVAWKRAGVIADRVKWGLWRYEEVLGIIEDLQRQKLSLNLMLAIICWWVIVDCFKYSGCPIHAKCTVVRLAYGLQVTLIYMQN